MKAGTFIRVSNVILISTSAGCVVAAVATGEWTLLSGPAGIAIGHIAGYLLLRLRRKP